MTVGYPNRVSPSSASALLAAGADNGGELYEMGWQPYRSRWLALSRPLRRLLVWMAKLKPVLAKTDN
jgi:hypothetical protein